MRIRTPEAIFDVLYGFIPITEWEERIINSPFYQRLRWVRQLGFTSYVFPGAEHNRFSHAIGVMHTMQKMLEALGLAVPNRMLFDRKAKSSAALLHKSLRIAALLHDLGTFPFSHALDYAYMKHGNDPRRNTKRSPKNLPNSHEHLGSFIIKNTRFEGGITQILEDYGLDVGMISKIIKGQSPYRIANQLTHSDLDADRLDYLIRDSHYTGIRYGQIDRDFILTNLKTFKHRDGQLGFGVNESALHAVEDFLMARFSWYSQVIRSPGAAKFDILATHVARALLAHDLLPQFSDLLTMIENGDDRFYWFNDHDFIGRCQQLHRTKSINDPMIAEIAKMLVFRIPPKTVQHPVLRHRLFFGRTGAADRRRQIGQIEEFVGKLKRALEKHGDGSEWILTDIPERDVTFASSLAEIHQSKPASDLTQERDPIKIVLKGGRPVLLVEMENSIIQRLAGTHNFVPSVFANEKAMAIFHRLGLVKGEERGNTIDKDS